MCWLQFQCVKILSIMSQESVQEETFKKWPFAKYFTYELTEGGKVDNVKCVLCSERWVEITAEANRRKVCGVSLASLKQYIDGIHYVHRSNLERHCAGFAHQFAKNLEKLTETSSDTSSIEPSQPRIDHLLITKSQQCYEKYFFTALWLALEELPTVKFGRAVDLQRHNGVNLPKQGTDSRHTGKVMTNILADVVRNDIKDLIAESHFLSGLSDGSEARKPREEKELIYAKFVCRGVPVTLFLKCQRMINFGGTDAEAVLKVIRDAFLNYGVDISAGGKDIYKLVSMCADGASVNMGCKKGALTVLKQDINWLLIVHCSLHKLELAIKDGFRISKDFEEIDSHMVTLFKTFKDSGKCWRVLLLLASKMGISVRRFVKSQGTRFQAHKKRALDVFIYNFCVLLMFAENAAETTGLLTTGMKARFQGFYKKWIQYLYPAQISFYREVLNSTTKLSLIIEQDDAMLTDVIDALEDCSDSMMELTDEKWQKLPEVLGGFQCVEDTNNSITMKVDASSAPSTLSLGDPSKLSEKQKEALQRHITVGTTSSQQFKLQNVPQGKQGVARMQNVLIPQIKKCIDERFDHLRSDMLIQAMRIIDHTTWDPSDRDYGKTQIATIATHYKESLAGNSFNKEKSQSEWQLLKKIAKRKYSSIKSKIIFWKRIYENEYSELSNILMIFEIGLSVAVAQGMVERGFSLTRRIITDSRTRLNNSTLDDLMVIRLNVPVLKSVLGDDYVNSLITKSVAKYTETKRHAPGKAVKRSHKAPVTLKTSKKKANTTRLLRPMATVLLNTSSSSEEEMEECAAASQYSDSDFASESHPVSQSDSESVISVNDDSSINTDDLGISSDSDCTIDAE